MPRDVRQHFTFYGFRFVKVEGWPGEVDPEDFTGLVIHSDMDARGDIVTSDPLVNQLVRNARWGMKGNFLDVPTDCPQRDERYGWTGDAQIFSGTASFFMDTYAFYTKYGRDIYLEQKKLNGSVPDVVPVANYPGDASTAWGDAATIIPWNVYLHSGDRGILRRQYPSMKGWVDYMKRQDDADGGKRLWLTGTHYADWLALDGSYPGGVYGGTDPNYIASAYYCHSTRIVAKAARVLGYAEDAAIYDRLAQEIRAAFERAYFTPSGRLAIDTMTGCVVALYMDLAPDYAVAQVRGMLLNRLQKNFYHLNTGFTGTPCLCRVLSENGMNDIAYHLLMEKGYPGWLYEVLMGATTIWERWNSVMPDGKVSGTEMNSMNHYSYGSIVEWMFRDMLGINPVEDAPGFKRFRHRAEAELPDRQRLGEAGFRLGPDRIRVGHRGEPAALRLHRALRHPGGDRAARRRRGGHRGSVPGPERRSRHPPAAGRGRDLHREPGPLQLHLRAHRALSQGLQPRFQLGGPEGQPEDPGDHQARVCLQGGPHPLREGALHPARNELGPLHQHDRGTEAAHRPAAQGSGITEFAR